MLPTTSAGSWRFRWLLPIPGKPFSVTSENDCRSNALKHTSVGVYDLYMGREFTKLEGFQKVNKKPDKDRPRTGPFQ